MTIKSVLKKITPLLLYRALSRMKNKLLGNIYEINSRREDFLNFLPKHSIGAEIGVFKGEFSEKILMVVKPKKLHLIDGWHKIYGEYYPWISFDTNMRVLKTTEAYNQTIKVLEKYNAKKICKVHVEDDLVCLRKINDNYFDWVYLDSSHEYEHTISELELLKDKVKDTGIILGHDWRPSPEHYHHEVYKAVNEFCEKNNWILFKLDNHAQWAIKKNRKSIKKR